MAKLGNCSADLDRRTLLRAFAQGVAAGVAGVGLFARRAAAQQPMLQAFIQQNQPDDFGRRTMPMPNASLPTLSPATVQATERAIGQYDAILARGGWPQVASVDSMRLGMRHPGVADWRRRLAAVGDLDAGGITDLYDADLEAAVRRFQARHGLTVDGIVREPTLRSI